MIVPLLDLKAQYAAIQADVDAAVAEVLSSQSFILGPKVAACEEAVARYTGCRHAVGVSSGSDALLIALMAEGIGPGDEVITSSFTFFATVGSIARLGAWPVFVDIDPVTYNLQTSQLAAKITDKTRAIIPVHLYGQMADMDGVMEVAKAHDLVVIEDAAQALGAKDREFSAGSNGHYGCFSFFPSKNLGAAGDGGMVVTSDAARAERLGCLRSHGSKPKYYHRIIGGNFRLDALQAAIVSAKLPYLDSWTERRRQNAECYNEFFSSSDLRVADSSLYSLYGWGPGVESFEIILPKQVASRHIYNQYVIRVPRRDAVREALRAKGVSTEVYYPVPMHLQECFAYLGLQEGMLPESESAAKETLALPIYPELTEAQIQHVVNSVREAVRSIPIQ